ncbi:hypothetical protein TNCV_3446781 [Trichonephila clavipes]|nr:hypothetical protein TNCV_3446781 [Trichonephila clavipes]
MMRKHYRKFQRKYLKSCILGGTNDSWRRRSSLELYKIYKQPDIVKFIKLQRLKWADPLARMNKDLSSKSPWRSIDLEADPH